MFQADSLKHPDLVELVPAQTVNPEKYYYYQKTELNLEKYQLVELEEDREHADVCEEKDAKTIKKTLKKFVPQTEAGKEMWKVLKSEMSYEKMVAVEVDHCP